MSVISADAQRMLESHASALIGDEVTLTLHNGDPGPEHTDNAVTIRTVTRDTFATGGVEFAIRGTGFFSISVRSSKNTSVSFLLNLDEQGSTTLALTPGSSIAVLSFPHMSFNRRSWADWM